MKRCSNCQVEKPLSEFPKRSNSKDGFRNQCKSCYNSCKRSWKKQNPQKVTEWHYKYNYGITVSQKEEMIKSQNNQCAICGEMFSLKRDTHVDHNHNTNEVRGILCSNCNTSLGGFKDSINNLESAIQYLKKFGGQL